MKKYLFIPYILLMLTEIYNHIQLADNIDSNSHLRIYAKIDPSIEGKTNKTPNFINGNISSESYIILNHLFTYNNPTMKYTISVNGRIYINEHDHREVRCCSRNDTMVVSVLSGSGTVKISGVGSINMGSFQVKKLNYNSNMNIVIKGKTHCLELPDDGCFTKYSSLSLEESWSKEMEWDIVTTDPENDDLRLNMLKLLAPTQIPSSPHTGRTLRFDYHYPGLSEYQHVSTVSGMGTFKWKYTYVSNRAAQYYSEHNPDTEQLSYRDDQPKPKDYPVPKGELGPPLEDIKWDLIELEE